MCISKCGAESSKPEEGGEAGAGSQEERWKYRVEVRGQVGSALLGTGQTDAKELKEK